jgi:hypothetical protein
LCGPAGGRYLKDLWLYDLNTLQWSVANATSAAAQVQDSEEAAAAEAAGLLDAGLLPASAGHSVTPWADGLLVLGGHVKVGGWRVSWHNRQQWDCASMLLLAAAQWIDLFCVLRCMAVQAYSSPRVRTATAQLHDQRCMHTT